MTRIQAEGKNTPADVVLTVDIARMMSYHRKGVLASIKSKVLDTNVPEHLRSSDNTWFALSKRARIVAISKDRVAPDEIKSGSKTCKTLNGGGVYAVVRGATFTIAHYWRLLSPQMVLKRQVDGLGA